MTNLSLLCGPSQHNVETGKSTGSVTSSFPYTLNEINYNFARFTFDSLLKRTNRTTEPWPLLFSDFMETSCAQLLGNWDKQLLLSTWRVWCIRLSLACVWHVVSAWWHVLRYLKHVTPRVMSRVRHVNLNECLPEHLFSDCLFPYRLLETSEQLWLFALSLQRIWVTRHHTKFWQRARSAWCGRLLRLPVPG